MNSCNINDNTEGCNKPNFFFFVSERVADTQAENSHCEEEPLSLLCFTVEHSKHDKNSTAVILIGKSQAKWACNLPDLVVVWLNLSMRTAICSASSSLKDNTRTIVYTQNRHIDKRLSIQLCPHHSSTGSHINKRLSIQLCPHHSSTGSHINKRQSVQLCPHDSHTRSHIDKGPC